MTASFRGIRAGAVVLTALVLSACSVGGGGSSAGSPVTIGSGGGSAPVAHARVAMTLHIPAAKAGTNARAVATAMRASRVRPKVVSSAALGLAVVLNDPTSGAADYEVDADISGANTTPGTTCADDPSGGGRSCTITITEPVGLYDFVVSTYGVVPSPGFAGQTPLDTGDAGQYTLSATAQTPITVTLGGVISTIQIVAPPSIDGYGSSSVPVGITTLDAANEVIISSTPYASPLTLTVSSTAGGSVGLSVNGGVSVATVSSSAPTDTIVLAYGGGSALGAGATLRLSAQTSSGGASAAATIAPLFITASGPTVTPATSPTLPLVTASTSDTITFTEGSSFNGTFTITPDPINGCVTSPAVTTPTTTSPVTFSQGGTPSTTPPASIPASGGVASLTVATGNYNTPAAGCVYSVSDGIGTTVRLTITVALSTGAGNIGVGVPRGLAYVTAYAQSGSSTNAMANPSTATAVTNPSILAYRLTDDALFGIADTFLRQPLGVAYDLAGDVFVADIGQQALTEYAPSALGPYGQTATDAAYARYVEPALTTPDGVAVDPKTGDVFVSDYGSGDIYEFSLPYPPGSVPMARRSLGRIRVPAGRSHPRSSAPPALVGTYAVGGNPAGIAFDSQDNLYVAFPNASAVSKYASVIGQGQGATLTTLTPVASIGSSSQFTTPTKISIGTDGTIYVLDTNTTNPQIVTYAPSNLATNAGTIPTFGGNAGSAFAVGSGGAVYESAVSNGTIMIYPGVAGTPFAGKPIGPSLTTGTAYVADLALSPAASTVAGTNLYVADLGNASMTVTPANASGNVAPTRTIVGSGTGINNNYGIAVDANGDEYASDLGGCGCVLVFAPGTNGNVAPFRTLSGSGTNLAGPLGLAIDSSQNLIVANFSGNSITEYAPAANGPAAPIRTISGSNTGLNLPYGITLDASNNLYVVNDASQGGGVDSVTVYPPGTSGNIAPARTITGSLTGMDGASYVAVDAAGQIYVTNGYNDSVTVYAAGANGNVAPIQTISGSLTTMGQPGGIAVDSSGYIYVGVYSVNNIAVFAPGTNGNVAPVRQIVGGNSGINGPSQLFLGP